MSFQLQPSRFILGKHCTGSVSHTVQIKTRYQTNIVAFPTSPPEASRKSRPFQALTNLHGTYISFRGDSMRWLLTFIDPLPTVFTQTVSITRCSHELVGTFSILAEAFVQLLMESSEKGGVDAILT